jgi:hypothetical protein
MENLKTTQEQSTVQTGGYKLTAERVIHASIFILLLVGLTTLSAWISYTYLQHNIVLLFASIVLSWGIILLVMYLIFQKLGWNWWS